MQIELDNGKYKYFLNKDGSQAALRYGEPWRDLTGDNLIYHMAQEIQELRNQVEVLTKLKDKAGECFVNIIKKQDDVHYSQQDYQYALEDCISLALDYLRY